MRLEQLQQRAPGVTAEPCRRRGRGQLFGLDCLPAMKRPDMRLCAAKFCHASLRDHTDTANSHTNTILDPELVTKAIKCEAEEGAGSG